MKAINGKLINCCLILLMTLALCCFVLPSSEAEAAFSIDAVLDSAQLHPQPTGYAALDNLLESIVAPLEGQSTSAKMKALYDWTVREIDYSWAAYRTHTYNGFYGPYPHNDYEEGLEPAFPQEIIDRTYYTMTNHRGVCYDWAAVYAVMARYVGLESYVHTGIFLFETNRSSGHHGWTEIRIDGVNYIFDPQREYRMCGDGTGTIVYSRYFGLRYSDTGRYTQETAINAARDAQFLSVTTARNKKVTVEGVPSLSGVVTGSGTYNVGDRATLTASPLSGGGFNGWYDAAGNLLSTDLTYSFDVKENTSVYAMFAGDYFYDVKANDWYVDYATKAAELKLVQGVSPYKFEGSSTMSRGMVVQIIANMESANLEGHTDSTFTDVNSGSWYTPAVAWAKANGIAEGYPDGTFRPDQKVSREEFITLIVNYTSSIDIEVEEVVWGNIGYSDKEQISDWARTNIAKAENMKLITGYENNTLRPLGDLSRAEGVTIFIRYLDFLAEYEKAQRESTVSSEIDEFESVNEAA